MVANVVANNANFVDGKRLVLEATDIVRLIGETVTLKKAGRRYNGLCPFHNEKSPSFSVDPAKQFFYCFGCKKGGNAIDFVIERDHAEFKDALHTLADWAGVELPRFEKNPEQADRRKQLLDAQSAAAEIYRKLLHAPQGKVALDYLRGRGFDDATIKSFGLGFAPAAWDTLAQHGLLRKFPAPLLAEGGLLKRRENGDGFYDTFRDRVLFPIRDEQGRPIAFGGRILPGSDNPAKYLNSPETPLFSKSRVLFGLDLAKKRIVESRVAVVFEGYADAAMAHQHGVTNSVAVLGTALTPDHAQTLRRLADKIVLLFDADAAGGMAAKRSVELFLREPVEVAVAELPAGVDPDEFLQEHGKEPFEQIIDKAPDALTFYWRQMHRQFDAATVTGREKALNEYLQTVADARDAAGTVDQARWGAILMRIEKNTGVRAADLNQRLRVEPPPRPAAARQEPRKSKWKQDENGKWRRNEPAYAGPRRSDLPGVTNESGGSRAEAQLLGALFNDPHLWQHVQAHVSPEDFGDKRYRWLAGRFWDQLRNEGEPSFAEWLEAAVIGVDDSAGAAARAKAVCIELADAAERLGEPRQVAAEATRFFLKRRDGRQFDDLLANVRRGRDEDASGGEAEASREEADMLRQLEARLRQDGRAGRTG